MKIIISILTNKIFYLTIFAWFFAQFIKIIVYFFKKEKFDFKWFSDTGGMPSAHSTYVGCLTTIIGKECNFNSPLFIITLCFSLVIMIDAAGFRRSTGKQAEVLNKIIKDINLRQKIELMRVRELLGHTPIEVFAGALLGIFIGLFLY